MKIDGVEITIDIQDLISLDGYVHLTSIYKIVSAEVINENSIKIVLKDITKRKTRGD